MVHYIRFLRTPQVSETKKKSIHVSAVVCITTDLGDAFLAQNLELEIQLLAAAKPYDVLQSQKLSWQDDSRALKVSMTCPAKFLSRSVRLHVAPAKPTSAIVPELMDVWSDTFLLIDKQRSEPIVERQFRLLPGTPLRSWEETGDSIARHIWQVICLWFVVLY